MLAAVRRDQEGKGFVVEDYPKPNIEGTDVLVRIEAAGLCGTGIEGSHIKRYGIAELLENGNIIQRKYVTG